MIYSMETNLVFFEEFIVDIYLDVKLTKLCETDVLHFFWRFSLSIVTEIIKIQNNMNFKILTLKNYLFF